MGLKEKNELVGKLLSVEIEYYPRTYITEADGNTDMELEGKGDGSLGPGGREVTALTWATDGLRLRHLLGLQLNGKVTKKCGLHVHVDARHLGKNGLLTAAEVYDKLTSNHMLKHLKALCPKSRHNNKYCKWVNNRVGSATYVHPRPSEGGQWANRYAAINFDSFRKFGTIEFRCQAGSINPYKIEMWALLCQHLVNWCAQSENKVNGKHRYWDYFLQILPEPLRSWAAVRKAAIKGGLDMQRIMAAMDNEEELVERGESARRAA